MRNFLFAGLAAFALYGASVGDAMGQNSNDGKKRWMIVKNESPFEAYQIYMIPSERKCCWSRDLLEDITIRPGAAPQAVNFDDGNRTCVVDIRVTTREYEGWDWLLAKVDVCTNREIVLRGKGSSGSPPLKVKNETLLTAINVYVIPTGTDCCWSRDLLREKVIPRGETLEVDLVDGRRCQPKIPLNLDIRVTSNLRGIDWYFDGVDVCSEVVRKFGLTLKGDGKDRWMTIKNKTTHQAYGAFIKRAGQDCCWSHNLLGKLLPGGEALEVDFDDHTGGCTFDIRITTREGNPAWFFPDVNVCTQSELILP